MTSRLADEYLTERMRLRPLHPSDYDDLVRFSTDPVVMATLAGVVTPQRVQEGLQRQLDHWQTHGFGWWSLRDRTTDEFLGRGGLKRVHIAGNDEVEIGYGLLAPYWGQGLAAEMAREALQLGFEVLDLDSIVCFTLPTNTRSRRVMEKVGFQYERDTVHCDLPHVLFRMRKEDWKSRHANQPAV